MVCHRDSHWCVSVSFYVSISSSSYFFQVSEITSVFVSDIFFFFNILDSQNLAIRSYVPAYEPMKIVQEFTEMSLRMMAYFVK